MLDQIKTLINSLPQAVEIHGGKGIRFDPPAVVHCSYFPVDYHVHAVMIDEYGDVQWMDATQSWQLVEEGSEEAATILKELQEMAASAIHTQIKVLINSLPTTEQDGEKIISFDPTEEVYSEVFECTYQICAVKIDREERLQRMDERGWWYYVKEAEHLPDLKPATAAIAEAILRRLQALQVQVTPTLNQYEL